MLYLTIIILLCIFVYRYDYCQKEKMSDFWYLFLLAVFILVAALRYRIGTDTVMYERYYYNAPTLTQLGSYRMTASRFAPLFLAFQAIPRTFSDNFAWFQLLHATYINCIYFWFIKKNANHPFTALLLYFFLFYYLLDFEQLRESCAVATFLLAWPAFKKNNWIVYYAICIAAIGFHVSASLTLFLPLCKLPFINQGFVVGKRTAIISLAIFAIGVVIQASFFNILKALAISEGVDAVADNYINSGLRGQMLNIFGIISRFLQFAAYVLAGLILLKIKSKKFDEAQLKEYKALSIMGLFFFYITVISVPIEILSRYQNYFCFFAFVIVSDCAFTLIPTKAGKQIRLRMAYWALIFMPLFITQTLFYIRPENKTGSLRTYMTYLPYENQITQYKDKNREDLFIYKRNRAW